MVARINIAVELHDAGMTALLGHCTDAGFFAHPVGQCGIEDLNEIFPDVLLQPFVEQIAQKVAPFLGIYGEGCELRSFFFRKRKCRTVGVLPDPFYDGSDFSDSVYLYG